MEGQRIIVNRIEGRPCWGKGAEMLFKTDDREAVESLMEGYVEGREYEVTIKVKTKKRSLDANAYCWVLCRKIANATGFTEQEVYKENIRTYGVTAIKPEQTDLVEDLVRMWDGYGLGNDHDILGESKLKGYTNVKYYYGSSQYNSRQMARLLDGIIYEAKDLGIPTETPAEIARMKESWK